MKLKARVVSVLCNYSINFIQLFLIALLVNDGINEIYILYTYTLNTYSVIKYI
jgi:hypothetical protein